MTPDRPQKGNYYDNIGRKEDWQSLSPEEKKRWLFLKQKVTLDSFLKRGAISQAQYDKSYNDMRTKMNIKGISEDEEN